MKTLSAPVRYRLGCTTVEAPTTVDGVATVGLPAFGATVPVLGGAGGVVPVLGAVVGVLGFALLAVDGWVELTLLFLSVVPMMWVVFCAVAAAAHKKHQQPSKKLIYRIRRDE